MNNEAVVTQDLNLDLNDRFLLFNIEDLLYGVSLALVLEIIQIQHITHLPGVAPYIEGIINLRGKVIPVLNVRSKLHLPRRDYDEKTCIVVVDMQDMQIGLIVDSVSEVITVDRENLTSPPEGGDQSMQYLSSVTEINGKAVLNIDFKRFFQEDIEQFANF